MEKIPLTVLGLSSSPAGNNAYALILKEENGERRMPIIIGAFEAQAIALEMEGVVPPRPMSHDLFRNFIKSVGSELEEVYISDLTDGTFYAKIILDDNQIELDSRPSDAIAMAVRFGCPIFVNKTILNETGVTPSPDMPDAFDGQGNVNYIKKAEENNPANKVNKLQTQLDKAIADEDYEKAANLRDQINNLLDDN